MKIHQNFVDTNQTMEKKQKSTESFSYRKGHSDDLEDLRLLGLSSYGQFKDTLSADAWKKMESGVGNIKTYEELLKVANCFVCEHRGKIVGMAFQVPKGNPFAFFESDWSYIRLIGVEPAYEGKGIGRRLTERCVEEARRSGEQIIALHTSEFQDAARHIYESMGFKVLRSLDPIYEKKYWLYTMNLADRLPEISYHHATIADLNALVELRIQFTTLLMGISAAERVAKLREQLQDYFSDAITRDTSIWIIATCDGKPVGIGAALIRKNPPNFKNPSGNTAYVLNMYTLPAFRRKGICKKILGLLEEEALRRGIKALELHATKEGELVYQQQGFELHDEPTYRKFL
jgi:GNAT superfamily N-acetyltransferase